MVNVYDILLNFQDSNRLYEFFEWESNDDIEHIKKIPMYKVSSNFLDNIINNRIIIDKSFLNKIYRKTDVYNHSKVASIDYACLFTDGYKVVAGEFDKDGKLLFKSSLLLDEEDEILDYSDEIETSCILYKKLGKKISSSLLTREEEYRKNYLLRELKSAKKSGKYGKINYLYEEIYPVSSNNIDDKYRILFDDISNNYRDCYNELFKILKSIHKKKKTTSN